MIFNVASTGGGETGDEEEESEGVCVTKEQLERENRSVPAEITERARIKLLFLD